jgi:hypothetical protein
LAGHRNLEESGVNTGIPVPQEFMQKIPVTAAKKRNSCNPLQNHIPVKNFSGKHRKKRNPQEFCFFCFWAPKIDSCQTGMGNLGRSQEKVRINYRKMHVENAGLVLHEITFSRMNHAFTSD